MMRKSERREERGFVVLFLVTIVLSGHEMANSCSMSRLFPVEIVSFGHQMADS